MTFLSLNVESIALRLQKNELEYEEMIISQQYNTITQKMADESEMYSDDESYDPTKDPVMQYYQQQQQLFDSQKSSLEAQLQVINSEIESYGKAVDANIKSECKLSISV